MADENTQDTTDTVVDAGELPDVEIVDVVEGEAPPVSEEQNQEAALGVNDLHLMAMVIDVVSQRGAIRANEMQNIGALYNKLVNFLLANGIIQDPNAPIPAPEGSDMTQEGEENA